jgi:tRNA-uridine 2-sulfurtransferase
MASKKIFHGPAGRGRKVVIALSGGVDSAVAAYLLKKQGFKVAGLYLRLFTPTPKCRRRKSLMWGFKGEEKEKRVKKIAKIIGIPLVVRDVREKFKEKVIDYFLREYQAGRTPNPCVACNREIKFKFLFEELARAKADFVATGHYARIIHKTSPAPHRRDHPSLIKEGMGEVFYKLFMAKDRTKDQSYFLYALGQKRLAKILFPLGNYKKEEIRKLARKLNMLQQLSADDKCRYEESQNVCFIADKNPDIFLKKNIEAESGDIIDTDGNILGKHEGLFLYTLGQRRGIKIGGRGPFFVVAKDLRKNDLIISNNPKDQALYSKKFIIEKVNWVSGKPPLVFRALVQARYRDPKIPAIIKVLASKKGRPQREREVILQKARRAVTPGQSAVFYAKNGQVLGGGIIK